MLFKQFDIIFVVYHLPHGNEKAVKITGSCRQIPCTCFFQQIVEISLHHLCKGLCQTAHRKIYHENIHKDHKDIEGAEQEEDGKERKAFRSCFRTEYGIEQKPGRAGYESQKEDKQQNTVEL